MSKLPTLSLKNPAHIGDILREYIPNTSPFIVAQILKCTEEEARLILRAEMYITDIMCLRLAYYFNTSYEFWYRMQHDYKISEMTKVEETIKQEVETLLENMSKVLDPDVTDTAWKYHMTGEYEFSYGRGYNSHPIRTKLSDLTALCADESQTKVQIDKYEVWINNSWVSPLKLSKEFSIFMSERRVSAFT